MGALIDKRVLFFGGKGGVGKTTTTLNLAAAVAPYVKPGAAIVGTGAGSITGWMYNLPKKLEGLV